MKSRIFLIAIAIVFAAEIIVLAVFGFSDGENDQDVVAVNAALKSVQTDWDDLSDHAPAVPLEYVVLDAAGVVRYRTGSGLSESIHAAVRHRDTVLDVSVGGETVGKLIVYNVSAQAAQTQKRTTIWIVAAALCVQAALCAVYLWYLKSAVIRPFGRMKQFAVRVAGGNLDVPLTMDRHNLFGAFTESFDLMRTELKKARVAEAEANASKKELVAKLSHDIRTPVASIQAAAEVGAACAQDERTRDNYEQIVVKAEQIGALVGNLFSATLEELQQLTVAPTDFAADEVRGLIESADYLHRSSVPAMPVCLVCADRLRLQQVFDNLFANSYKYADTAVDVSAAADGGYLAVRIEDHGGGVGDELPLLKEKYKRGRNAAGTGGAGLGLYLSDYFMREMHGELLLENGADGLRATVRIPLSGAQSGRTAEI